jgi:hypothetical protein
MMVLQRTKMSDSDYDNAERNARIDKQFDETYRFYRDVIDDPQVLSVIPDGSVLKHRTIQFDDRRVQLTAHRPSESEEPWTVRVTSWDSRGSLDEDKLAIEARLAGHLPASEPAPVRRVEDDDGLVRTGATADAALDALEHPLRQRPALIASGEPS